MANTYETVRFEPMCSCDDQSKVCSVVIGMNVTDETGKFSDYIDGVYTYDEDKRPTIDEFNAGASALVSQYASNYNWYAVLDSRIESQKKRDVPPENYEAPEITLDTTVEPEPGSIAAELAEESSEEESGGE